MAVSSPTEGSLQLTIRELAQDGTDEFRTVSEPITLASVQWLAEMRVVRQTYSNPNFRSKRTYVWYHYHLSVSCILPEDTKYFNCNAEVEHSRYWINDDVENNTTNNDQKKKKVISRLVERLNHRYTHDNRSLFFSLVIDPGTPGEDPAIDRALRVDLKIKLFEPISPVVANKLNDDVDAPWHDLDIVFDRQQRIRTSKAILASTSPFFRALLFGDFKEKGVDTVELPNVNVSDFKELLRYVYPNCRQPISENNVETLLFMADRFLMETVTEDCEKFLLFCKDEQISLDVKTFLADMYRLPRLKQQCAFDLTLKLDKCTLKD